MAKKIPLTRGLYALVDDEDYPYLSQFKWRASSSGYAVRSKRIGNGKKKTIFMHREILGVADSGIDVDHINMVKADNRRCNLRPCTRGENQRNRVARGGTSKYKGVYWHKRYRRWVAKICHDGRYHFLGYYNTQEEAAAIYDKHCEFLHGEFANINGVRLRVQRDGATIRASNTSGFRGISLAKGGQNWQAQITYMGNRYHLGTFSTPESAARAYDAKARELKGDKARLNFPD